MKDGWANEQDPFLREIFALGWDEVYCDRCTQKMVLVMHNPKQTKSIDLSQIGLGAPFEVKQGILPDGSIHSWVAEADGNANRFRDLVRPTEGISKKE